MQRVSAIALVPLTMWFFAAIIAKTGADYTAFVAWMRNPITDILMALLLIALFYHAALGLQVVVEDYVHSDVKFAAVIAVRLACFTLGTAGILATLRIAFRSLAISNKGSFPFRALRASRPANCGAKPPRLRYSMVSAPVCLRPVAKKEKTINVRRQTSTYCSFCRTRSGIDYESREQGQR